MKKTLNLWDFEDSFNNYYTYKNNFSHPGKKALFEYLIELEEDTGEEQELDIVALCCDYKEYDSFKDLKEEFGEKLKYYDTLEELEKDWGEYFSTFLVTYDKSIVVKNKTKQQRSNKMESMIDAIKDNYQKMIGLHSRILDENIEHKLLIIYLSTLIIDVIVNIPKEETMGGE